MTSPSSDSEGRQDQISRWLSLAKLGQGKAFKATVLSQDGVQPWPIWACRPHIRAVEGRQFRKGALLSNYPDAGLYTRVTGVITDPNLVGCQSFIVFQGCRIETQDGILTSWAAQDASDDLASEALRGFVDGSDLFEFRGLISPEGEAYRESDLVDAAIYFPDHYRSDVNMFLERGKEFKSISDQKKHFDSVIEDVVLDMGAGLMDFLIGPEEESRKIYRDIKRND